MSKDTVQDGLVVSMEYTLKVDGEVTDTSEGREPLAYLQGSGNIIPGLEREMVGMAVGESKEVMVAAVDAYGEEDDKAFMDVPRGEFPKDIPETVAQASAAAGKVLSLVARWQAEEQPELMAEVVP